MRDHSWNYQFSYTSVTFKRSQFSPTSLPKVQYSKTLLRSQSKVLFELYQKHFPYLPPDGRWIHFLESEPDPALPEVVMQRNPLWPRLEFSTTDADSDTAQFSPMTRCRDFHLTKELANPNWFQRLRDWLVYNARYGGGKLLIWDIKAGRGSSSFQIIFHNAKPWVFLLTAHQILSAFL